MISRGLLTIGMAAAGLWAWRRVNRPAPISLRDKVVVITGASGGLGLYTARAFAAQRAILVLVARRETVLTEVKAELSASGAAVLTIPADITQEGDRQRVVQTTLETYGRIDVLVNNAGLAMGGYFTEHDADYMRKLLDLNVHSLIRLTQLVLPGMLEKRSGQIINISSVAGLVVSAGETAYAASKAAVNGFSDALRREVAQDGVHVGLMMPGWIETPMIEHISDESLRAARMYPWMFPRQKPEYVAEAIVDMVRYKRKRVRLGGLGFFSGSLMQRLSPQLYDWIYRVLYDRDTFIRTLNDLG